MNKSDKKIEDEEKMRTALRIKVKREKEKSTLSKRINKIMGEKTKVFIKETRNIKENLPPNSVWEN